MLIEAAALQRRRSGYVRRLVRFAMSALQLWPRSTVLRDVLVGTEGGALHALRLEEKEKRERTWAPLLQLDGTDGNPVRGCHQQVSKQSQTSWRSLCVLVLLARSCVPALSYSRAFSLLNRNVSNSSSF